MTSRERRAQRQSAAIDEYVARLVATMPPLTDEQVETAARILAGLLPGDLEGRRGAHD